MSNNEKSENLRFFLFFLAYMQKKLYLCTQIVQ